MKTLAKMFEAMLTHDATPTWKDAPSGSWTWGGSPESSWTWGGGPLASWTWGGIDGDSSPTL